MNENNNNAGVSQPAVETQGNVNAESTNNAGTSSTNTAPISTAPERNTVMAVLAYIGPLVIVSYLLAKDDPFVKFHIKQGFTLFVIEVIAWIISMVMYQLWPVTHIINIAALILSILGIVNAVKGQEKSLPIVGKYSSHFKI